MSVIIRLQNLPWSANALDIRNYFRGLSIPEGGVHIVGGELGDAFIAFSTDEDARQAMMLDCGKLKEIQVKLLLSSRSEMHKVIEAARQSVPLPALPPPAPVVTPVPVPAPAPPPAPILSRSPALAPFASALGGNSNGFPGLGIPGLGNPLEIPQPAVIEPPAPIITTPVTTPNLEFAKEDDKPKRDSKDKERRRSRSRSRDKKDRPKKDRRERSRSRDRSREKRRRDRSRSRERRDRRRDRKERSRSRERSPRRSRSHRNSSERKSPTQNGQMEPKVFAEKPAISPFPAVNAPQLRPAGPPPTVTQAPLMPTNPFFSAMNGPQNQPVAELNRFAATDPGMVDTFNRLQELGKKRNPNAFQGDSSQPNGGPPRFRNDRGGFERNVGVRRDGRVSRFDNEQHDCCVVIKSAPHHTSYGDVRRFFPYMIDKHGIKMINDNNGRRTGTIYVRFCEPRSKHMAMQRDDYELKGQHVTVESLDGDDYEAAVDSYLPYREDNDEDANSSASVVIIDSDNTQTFTILKLSDLPFFVKEHDIIKSFSDFSLLSIMLIDCRSTRSKTAFVQFVNPEDARKALDRKDRYVFGRRPATVAVSTDVEYEKAKCMQSERSLPHEPIVAETAAPSPPEIVPRDPRQRRPPRDLDPAPVSAALLVPPDVSGNFFAPFPNPGYSAFPVRQPGPFPHEPRPAWGARPSYPAPRLPLGPRPPVVPLAPRAAPPLDDADEPLDCVLMKGLPIDATDRTIVDFLSGTGAVPSRIHLMLDPHGVPSGDCFCEFRTPQEARRAATKHGCDLAGCRVTVDLVDAAVVEEALEGPKPPPEERRDDTFLPHLSPGGYSGTGRGTVPYRGGRFDRGGFDRGGFDRGGFNRGGHDRGGFDRGGFDRGGFERGGRGARRGMRGFDTRGRGRGFGRGRGGGSYEPIPRPEPEDEVDPALEDFGAPGCVVSMENVPFRASVDDILSFFGDFELTQDDVIRRFNERGQPTGDARIAFRTPFDAQRAVKTRNMTPIHERRISLKVL